VGSDGVDVLRGVHTPTRTAGDNRCQGSRSDRPEAGLPLTTVGPPVIRHSSHEHHEEHHRPSPMTPISRSRSGWPGRGAASDGRGRIQQQVAASASDCSGRDRPRTRSTVNGPGRRSTDDGRRPRFRTTAPVNGQRPWSWSTVDGPWISSPAFGSALRTDRNSQGCRSLPLGPFLKAQRRPNRERPAPRGKDLGGLRARGETRGPRRSPSVAKLEFFGNGPQIGRAARKTRSMARAVGGIGRSCG
jgi:hypothetical protein